MVKLYHLGEGFDKKELIFDNESFFNNNISAKTLSDSSVKAMLALDKAILLDRRTGKIETPFGITGIKSLSTGCKTLLNLIFVIENPDVYPSIRAINGTECGWNALEAMFSYLEKMHSDIGVIIEHDNDLFKCKDREYLVDNVQQISSMLYF